MSETPKLLALMAQSRDLPALEYSKQLEVLVRELERENAALAEENRRLHVELDAYHNEEQLRRMRAENAALRAALTGMVREFDFIKPLQQEKFVLEKARAALARKEAQP